MCAGRATGPRRRGGWSRSCGRCSGSPAVPPGAATGDRSCLCSALLCDRPRRHSEVGRRPRSTLLAANGGRTRVHGAAGGVESCVADREQKGNIIINLQQSFSNSSYRPKTYCRRGGLCLFFTHRQGVLKKGAVGNGGTVGSEEPRRGSPAGFHRHVAH